MSSNVRVKVKVRVRFRVSLQPPTGLGCSKQTAHTQAPNVSGGASSTRPQQPQNYPLQKSQRPPLFLLFFSWAVFEEPGFSGESYILERGMYGCPEDWGALQPRIASAMPVVLVRAAESRHVSFDAPLSVLCFHTISVLSAGCDLWSSSPFLC